MFLRSVETGKGRFWVPILIVLGVLTKEIVVTTPALIFVLDAVLIADGIGDALKKRGKMHALHMIATSPLILLFKFRAMGPSQTAVTELDGRMQYVLAIPGALGRYLRLAVWPRPLTNDYADWPLGFHSTLEAWLGIAFLVLFVLFLARRFIALLPVAVALIVLSPTLGIVAPLQGEIVAERRMYLPLIGLSALLCVGAYAAVRSAPRWLGVVRVVALGVTVLVALGLTILRNTDYMNSIAIHTADVRARPNNARAYTWLSRSWVQNGQLALAVAASERAVQLDPKHWRSRAFLASAYSRTGNYERAAMWGKSALVGWSRDDGTIHTTATALLRTGEVSEATALLERRVASPDAEAPVIDLLAWILATEPEVRDAPRAVQLSDRALRKLGGSVPPPIRLTKPVALAAAGRFAEASVLAGQSAAELRRGGDNAVAEQLEDAQDAFDKRETWPLR